tara:strand:- start:7 stop:219 length:213 start_codon:yes stop_codon:yes gene_type:complete
LDSYLNTDLFLKTFSAIGKSIKQEISVFSKHKKSKSPIDEVPLCGEIYNVPKENIVVNPLYKMAEGVLVW